MPNKAKFAFLQELSQRYGKLHKLSGSYSLYQIPGRDIRIYIRYSRVHSGNKTWYGLRERDLLELEGYPAIICFIWENQVEPLLVPYTDYEDIFQTTTPAEDGQYKLQVLLQEDATELYIARVGRFNVEGYFGWKILDDLFTSSYKDKPIDLSHTQVQTLLGSIGTTKDFDVWIPSSDRPKLDWTISQRFECRDVIPYGFEQVKHILKEVDVIWLRRGSSDMRALFEVEHSTPIYSGLLRFNDIHLMAPNLRPRFSIVANDTRRSLFAKQLNRPTFQSSGLSELCTFLEYDDVYYWHTRIAK